MVYIEVAFQIWGCTPCITCFICEDVCRCDLFAFLYFNYL